MSTLTEERRLKALAYGMPYGLLGSARALSEESSELIKGFSVIARRAAAGAIALELAYALQQGDEDEKRLFYRDKSRNYGVDPSLTQYEMGLFHGENTEHDLDVIVQSKEALGMLMWMLGGHASPIDPTLPMRVEEVVRMMNDAGNIQTFIERAHVVDFEDIMVMLDLYRLYDEENIGDKTIVHYRRQALEWLITNENDWLRVPV